MGLMSFTPRTAGDQSVASFKTKAKDKGLITCFNVDHSSLPFLVQQASFESPSFS